MAQHLEHPDAAADRLESALERIATAMSIKTTSAAELAPDNNLSIAEIADRLDSLIIRLRSAIDKSE